MSEVSIANRALALLGENKITSLTDETQAAKAINNVYKDSLKSILSECCWSFAKKRVNLNMLTTKPAWGGGNYFQLPADMVAIFRATTDKYELEGDKLITDEKEIGILYTYLNTDSSMYSPAFVDAFACRLAYDVCYDLTNNKSKQDDLLSLYTGQFLPIAKSKNARNNLRDNKIQDDAWIAAIYGGVNG